MIPEPVSIPKNVRIHSGRRCYVGKAPKALVKPEVMEAANKKLEEDEAIKKKFAKKKKSEPVRENSELNLGDASGANQQEKGKDKSK